MREFWTLPLKELTPDEWEALCDRCAKCCYLWDTDNHVQTTEPCKLLDQEHKSCKDYRKRFVRVGLLDGYRCHKVNMRYIESGQLPDSCAYVKCHRNEPLEQWQVDKAIANGHGC